MKSKTLAAAGLVFGSGAAALLYQTAWLREFRLVFGSTTGASAAVLGIFMGGLGLGSALLGRRVEAQARPLAFYARLELLIAASAALTPALIWLVKSGYLAMGGTLTLGIWFGTIVRLLLAAIVLLVPTFLMGGTLPAIARFAVPAEDDARRGLAALYGLNTLGAVTGAGIGTFFLFERFGNHLSLWIACLLNAAVAALAFWLARYETAAPKPAPEKASTQTAPAASYRLVLSAAAVSGFLFLLMELVWFRMLSPILGGTTFTMGLILGVALLGIGAGGVAYSLAGKSRLPTLGGFAFTCALEALFIAIPYAMGDRLALASMLLQPLGSLGFYGRIISWLALSGIVIFPAAFIAGIQFPMLIGLLGKGRREIAAQTGAAYAWNTGGAIVGSLVGGFILIPLLTAPGTWRLVVFCFAGCASIAAFSSGNGSRSFLRGLPPVLISGLALLMLFSTGPTAAWRHGQLGLGLQTQFELTPNDTIDLLHSERRDILWEADGVETSIGISKGNSLAFMVNGKCDGNARNDAGTQVMAGLLGGLFHPKPVRAAVVGLGTGSTAGWLAAIPSIERVDAMEIEPVVAKFTAQCAAVNQNVMQSPKLRLMIGDARESLLTVKSDYDIIVSEPSNPYRVGIANLFTREYYQAARAKLRPGGFFVQWLQTYDVDQRTTRIFYATFSSVFPHVETWQTQAGDLLLIGSQEPTIYDVAQLRERIKQSPFREGLQQVWRVDDLEGVFGHFVSNWRFPSTFLHRRSVPLNTDDRPLLEFAFARNLARTDTFDFRALRTEAFQASSSQPEVKEGALDWPKVESQRAAMFVAFEQQAEQTEFANEEQAILFQAFRANANDDLPAALEAWRKLEREPRTIAELVMVAECLADKGDEAAIPLVEKMRDMKLPETEAIAARFLWRHDRQEQAAEILEAAFVKFRRDPWPNEFVIKRSLKLAADMAAESGKELLAERLYHALQKPFAIYNADERRQDALLSIAVTLDQWKGEYSLAEVEKAEPFVPWRLEFLRIRAGAYRNANHPRAAAAERDLDSFLSAAGESSPPAPSSPDRVASASQ